LDTAIIQNFGVGFWATPLIASATMRIAAS